MFWETFFGRNFIVLMKNRNFMLRIYEADGGFCCRDFLCVLLIYCSQRRILVKQ